MARTTPHRPVAEDGEIRPAHHLLADLKRTLDESKRRLDEANRRLAGLETAHNEMAFHRPGVAPERVRELEREREFHELELHIDNLYDDYVAAQNQFMRLEQAYEIACQYNLMAVIAINLRNLLLTGRGELRNAPGVREALADVAAALHTYCWKVPSDEADEHIRTALGVFDHTVSGP